MAHIDFSHGGNIYQIEDKHRKKILDFSANINPLGLNKTARKTVIKNINNILHYPDWRAENLVKKITSYWKVNERNVLLGNGSCELIYLIASFFRPKKAIIVVPTFSEYERALKSVKSKLQFLKLKEKEGFLFNISELNPVDMLFVCNPNNPTGNLLIKHRAIKNFPAKLTVIDETFMDFLPDEKRHTFIQLACRNKNIAVLRTFTKFFALPGLRIGYLIAHADLVQKLKRNCVPWNTNVFAQTLAGIILNDKEYIKNTHKLIEEQRRFLIDRIKKIKGLIVYPSAANFLLIKIIKNKLTSLSLRKTLIQKGILIRDCSNFRNLGPKFIRVAVRSHNQNRRLIAALKEALDDNS